MAQVKFKGSNVRTIGELPKVGTTAPPFTLVKQDLTEFQLESVKGKKKVLNIFPSMDTSVCALSVETFYKQSKERNDLVVLNISMDLPFAAKRFCETKGWTNALTLSAFRSPFPKDYGIEIIEGPLKGLCARAVMLLDEQNRVVYTELVPEITQEPAYDKALAPLSK